MDGVETMGERNKEKRKRSHKARKKKIRIWDNQKQCIQTTNIERGQKDLFRSYGFCNTTQGIPVQPSKAKGPESLRGVNGLSSDKSARPSVSCAGRFGRVPRDRDAD